jgi:hypothetical protein
MPLSPRRSRTLARMASRVVSFPSSSLRHAQSRKFCRKKEPLKTSGLPIESCSMMSRVTLGVAVAVSASTGTRGKRRLRPERVR